MRRVIFLSMGILLGGCQLTPEQPLGPHSSESTPYARSSPEWRGLKFARNRCSDCHAVEPSFLSPNPAAPTFEAVSNMPGLDGDSLAKWLKNSHNFPDEMYFEVPQEHVDELVAYILTLREEGYEPAN